MNHPQPHPDIPGVWRFDTEDQTKAWLEESFPVNMARIRAIQEGSEMNATKEARRDAQEYARAQMYYGDGAGIRRKLIIASVDSKISRDPTYARAFHSELSHQDMGEHASKARKERERADRNESLRRNTRAILTGNHQNAQTGILILILAGTVAHKTGYDKKMYEKSKEYLAKAKLQFKQYRQKLHSVD